MIDPPRGLVFRWWPALVYCFLYCECLFLLHQNDLWDLLPLTIAPLVPLVAYTLRILWASSPNENVSAQQSQNCHHGPEQQNGGNQPL